MTSTPITQMIKLRKKLRSRETTQQVITHTPAHTHTKVPDQAEETCSSEGTGDPWQWEVTVVGAGLTGHLVWGCPGPGTAPPGPQGPQADVAIHKCSLSPSQDSALHPSLPAAADTWLWQPCFPHRPPQGSSSHTLSPALKWPFCSPLLLPKVFAPTSLKHTSSSQVHG